MFEKILRFFVDNARINYLLFVLIFLIGGFSYLKTPKEIFPSFELDMVTVTGYYPGASIDILDKMAVTDIEDEIRNIDGVREMTTVITAGKFNFILELEKGTDRYNTADKVKDAIALASANFPPDMDMPIVSVGEIKRDLMRVALSSKQADHATLIQAANTLKKEINSIKNISEVIIYGDSDLYYDVVVDIKKLQALGIEERLLFRAISKLSYIYPIGEVEDKKAGFHYISTFNGPKSAQKMLNSKIHIQGKQLYLKDVASVQKRYEDAASLFSIDGIKAVDIAIKQSPKGNALTLSTKIAAKIQKLNHAQSTIRYTIHNDQSVHIKDRLNIIISNILLGLILIGLLVALLINVRMSFIISLGIPTSFVLGAFYLFVAGYTINMISLIGVLIALGIIVDDAIVVSENIQQHVEAGLAPKEAAIKGASEMFKPVTIASLTTLFAFIPALMMSGTMGEVIKLIPIAVSILVLASLIESFIFLPIHAAHTLKKGQKAHSWERANRVYSRIIHYLLHYKKSFLILFILIVPLLIILGLKHTKFQMFPRFDATTINLALKANVNTDTKETAEILETIARDIFAKKEQFYIAHLSSVAGWRRDSAGTSETYPYVGQITIELQKLKAQNFVDRFITPNLSFYYDKEGREREEKSQVIAKKLRQFLQQKAYKKDFNLTDIDIVERKVGPIKADIKIGLISNDDTKIRLAMSQLKSTLSNIEGITTITDNLNYGVDEIKLQINAYGESLGLSEEELGSILSTSYLKRKSSLIFDKAHLLEVKVRSQDKDSLEALRNYELKLENGERVLLKEVANFTKRASFEKLVKDFGEKNFYLYANVNTQIITATEVLERVAPLLKEFENSGVKIKLKGEDEKKKELKRDMIAASTLAMLLILLSLLYLFNSFKETFMMMSVIPFAFLGVLAGHFALGLNLSMPSIIGMLGLSGIVINDGIIMIMNLKKAHTIEEVYLYAAKRFRPIVLTSITTLIGLSSLIFFPTGQATIFQPMAIALGFGLAWGTVLNLLYLPALYSVINAKKLKDF
jgi:multidrug efflux pump subunit AcrB